MGQECSCQRPSIKRSNWLRTQPEGRGHERIRKAAWHSRICESSSPMTRMALNFSQTGENSPASDGPRPGATVPRTAVDSLRVSLYGCFGNRWRSRYRTGRCAPSPEGGWAVAVTARSAGQLQDTVRQSHGQMIAVPADVSKPESVRGDGAPSRRPIGAHHSARE
jgi:hypothetical protein